MENDYGFDVYVEWTPANLLEVTISEPDSFLKIRKTLTLFGFL